MILSIALSRQNPAPRFPLGWFFSRLILFLALSAALPGRAEAAQPPNIILIISDDQGFPDYGFMGNPHVRTPHLDRMASQSLLYTRGYVMPLCSPSLACLLTGKMPHSNGITGNDIANSRERAPMVKKLLGNGLLLPKALVGAGYLTLQTGKLWNVGYKEIGFTHGMTLPGGRHGGEGLAIGRKTMQPVFDFIETAQARKKPFFVWYAPMMPHLPHTPPPELLAHYENLEIPEPAKKYYAMVEWFDQTCGALDDYLQRNHLAENTVILYLTDNGWSANRGDGDNRAKRSPHELGIRTPMFVRWPGKVAPQRDEETLASIIDFVPTILKLSGAASPAPLPGLDLLDRKAMTERKSVFVEAYTQSIWDLEEPARSLMSTVTIDGWLKLISRTGLRDGLTLSNVPPTAALYDLRNDPLEKKDLAKERPEDVERLRALQDAAWRPQR